MTAIQPKAARHIARLCILFVFTAMCPSIASAQIELEQATPESQGLSTEALNELASSARKYVEQNAILGGELVIIKDRAIVLHEAFGVRDREDEKQWVNNTICNIRSMTKPLTGAAAQILIDRGRLSLDDTVSKYLPGFDNDKSRDITVGQLITHRSGLPLSIMMTVEDMSKYDSLFDQANAIGEGGPEFEPGSRFWYSDAGTDSLAAVIEVVSGMKMNEFWDKEIFGPLGMDDTFVPLDVDDPRFERIASAYAGAVNAWTRFWNPADGPLYPYAWGSQTVYSTPIDYAKFLAMWMDGGHAGDRTILSSDAIKRTLTPVSPQTAMGSDARYPTEFPELEAWYGQMATLWMPVENPAESKPIIFGHSGSDGTAAWAWPDRDLIICFFTQSRGSTSVLRFEGEIDRLLLHPERAQAADAPEEFRKYVGTYLANFANYRNTDFTVRMHNGKLALDIPGQMLFDLMEPDESGMWKFAVAPAEVSVSFSHEVDGEMHLLQLHQSGMTFDLPRKGTKLAEELTKLPTVDPEKVKAFVGTYHDPEANVDLVLYVEQNVLCLKSPPNLIFHLRELSETGRWEVIELPIAQLSFQIDASGEAVSLTRHINESELVMPRVKQNEAGEGEDEGGG